MEGRSQRRGWLGKLFMSSCQLLVEMSQKSYIRDEPVVVDREAGVERD